MVVGRLAPSPTGAQHLGNARTFLIAWLFARKQNGELILRIEDIDSPRIKPWAAQQAVDDLRWLGLNWDEGPDQPKPPRKYVQSERIELYREHLQKLQNADAIYPCTCSRSDVQEAASAPHELSDGPVYGRTCFHRKSSDAGRLKQAYAWRFRTPNQMTAFEDGVYGMLSTNVSDSLGDFVVYKNDDSPAYQLSVVIDDHDMGINEVVRGDDLVPSTFRQLNLYEFFGWTAPRFVHVPLVVGADGRRLAKRHGDTRLSHFRERNVKPERIMGLLEHSLGWSESPREISAIEMLETCQLKKIPREPWVFEDRHLEWLLG